MLPIVTCTLHNVDFPNQETSSIRELFHDYIHNEFLNALLVFFIFGWDPVMLSKNETSKSILQ